MMERAHGCDCSSVSGLVTPGSQNNLYEVTVITIMSDLGTEALSLSVREEGRFRARPLEARLRRGDVPHHR